MIRTEKKENGEEERKADAGYFQKTIKHNSPVP
jgi:hypothetical protein